LHQLDVRLRIRLTGIFAHGTQPGQEPLAGRPNNKFPPPFDVCQPLSL
jgi:hypothetical protein